MRNTKLLAMFITFCMVLIVFAGCSGGTSAPTTEEPTTTTTAAPTPTPEPTAKPTPTPPVEKWVTDERLCGTSWFRSDSGMYTVWTFKDNNTGYIFTMFAAEEGEDYYNGQYPLVFKYSVISDGIIRIVYSDETRSTYSYLKEYQDYKYGFDVKYLQLESMNPNDTTGTMKFSRRAWDLY